MGIVKFIMYESGNEIFDKCRKNCIISIVTFVAATMFLVPAIIMNKNVDIVLIVMALSLVFTVFLILNGLNIIKKIESGTLKEIDVTIIKTSGISRNVEAVTDDEENILFYAESDLKLKKNRKYHIFYSDENGEKVINYAKQISVNKINTEKDMDQE